MTADEAVVAVIGALEAAGVPYMIVDRNILAVRGVELDWTYLRRHGTLTLLEAIRESIPPMLLL